MKTKARSSGMNCQATRHPCLSRQPFFDEEIRLFLQRSCGKWPLLTWHILRLLRRCSSFWILEHFSRKYPGPVAPHNIMPLSSNPKSGMWANDSSNSHCLQQLYIRSIHQGYHPPTEMQRKVLCRCPIHAWLDPADQEGLVCGKPYKQTAVYRSA